MSRTLDSVHGRASVVHAGKPCRGGRKPAANREFMEHSIGPMQNLVATLAADSEKLASVRHEYTELARPYYVDNTVRQDYLFTRAVAR